MNVTLFHGVAGWTAAYLAILGLLWILLSAGDLVHTWLDSGTWRKHAEPARRYAEARRALDINQIEEIAQGVRCESPQFVSLNRAVIDAETGISWWRRALIDSRVRRELDFRYPTDGAA